MIQTKTVECPACGAGLPWREGARELKCEYCGSIVAVDDDKTIPLPESRAPEKKEAKPKLTAEDEAAAARIIQRYRLWKILFIVFTVLSVILIAPESEQQNGDNFWAGVFIEAATGWFVVSRKSRPERVLQGIEQEKRLSASEKKRLHQLKNLRRLSIAALMLGGLLAGANSSDAWVAAAICGAVGWAVTASRIGEM